MNPTPAPGLDPASASAVSASRNYLFMAGMALLTLAAVMFVRSNGSLLAALLPTMIAATGLLLRWRAAPPIALLLIVYFILLPFGFPMGRAFRSDIPGSAFRLFDLILVAACLVYFCCQYRLFSLKSQAMPSDKAVSPAAEKRRMRAESNVAADEFQRMAVILAACLFLGQFLWLTIGSIRLDFHDLPPFEIRTELVSSAGRNARREPSRMTESRFLMLVGPAAAAALGVGFLFWYSRLAKLSRDEGRMMLLDTAWRENRRELNRQEKWRGWSLHRSRLAQGLIEEPVKKKGSSVSGCLQLLLFAICGPIALYLMFRLIWPILAE